MAADRFERLTGCRVERYELTRRGLVIDGNHLVIEVDIAFLDDLDRQKTDRVDGATGQLSAFS